MKQLELAEQLEHDLMEIFGCSKEGNGTSNHGRTGESV